MSAKLYKDEQPLPKDRLPEVTVGSFKEKTKLQVVSTPPKVPSSSVPPSPSQSNFTSFINKARDQLDTLALQLPLLQSSASTSNFRLSHPTASPYLKHNDTQSLLQKCEDTLKASYIIQNAFDANHRFNSDVRKLLREDDLSATYLENKDCFERRFHRSSSASVTSPIGSSPSKTPTIENGFSSLLDRFRAGSSRNSTTNSAENSISINEDSSATIRSWSESTVRESEGFDIRRVSRLATALQLASEILRKPALAQDTSVSDSVSTASILDSDETLAQAFQCVAKAQSAIASDYTAFSNRTKDLMDSGFSQYINRDFQQISKEATRLERLILQLKREELKFEKINSKSNLANKNNVTYDDLVIATKESIENLTEEVSRQESVCNILFESISSTHSKQHKSVQEFLNGQADFFRSSLESVERAQSELCKQNADRISMISEQQLSMSQLGK